MQQRDQRQPLPSSFFLQTYLFNFLFFSSSLGERGETSPRWHPSLLWKMAFLVRCYANCLQPWSSKVSDVVIPFLASASGLGCCRRRCVYVCVCVCVLLKKRDRVWMRENELDLNAHEEYLSGHALLLPFNLNFHSWVLKNTDIHNTEGTMPKPLPAHFL